MIPFSSYTKGACQVPVAFVHREDFVHLWVFHKAPLQRRFHKVLWDVEHTEGLYEAAACFAKPLALSYIHTLILIFFLIFICKASIQKSCTRSQAALHILRWPVFVYWMRCRSDSCIRYGSHLHIWYGTGLIVFLLLLLNIVVCDLYFDSHILVVLIIILILIIHINCIHYVYVREY